MKLLGCPLIYKSDHVTHLLKSSRGFLLHWEWEIRLLIKLFIYHRPQDLQFLSCLSLQHHLVQSSPFLHCLLSDVINMSYSPTQATLLLIFAWPLLPVLQVLPSVSQVGLPWLLNPHCSPFLSPVFLINFFKLMYHYLNNLNDGLCVYMFIAFLLY